AQQDTQRRRAEDTVERAACCGLIAQMAGGILGVGWSRGPHRESDEAKRILPDSPRRRALVAARSRGSSLLVGGTRLGARRYRIELRRPRACARVDAAC